MACVCDTDHHPALNFFCLLPQYNSPMIHSTMTFEPVPSPIPEGSINNLSTTSPEKIQDYAEKHNEAIYLVGSRIQASMLRVAGLDSTMDEKQLSKYCDPSDKVKAIRINFWNEYYTAIKEQRNMVMDRIYSGVCTHVTFYGPILRFDKPCMWIFRPMGNYDLVMEEQLHKGLKRIEEILDLPLHQNGKISTATATLILRTVQMVENRVKGAVTQKHEHKNLNVTIAAENLMPKDLMELEAKIALLEGQPAPPTPQDAPQVTVLHADG